MICLGEGLEVKITPTSQTGTCTEMELPENPVKNADSGSTVLEWLPDGAAATAGAGTTL